MARYPVWLGTLLAGVTLLVLVPAASPQSQAVLLKKVFSPYRAQHRHFENVNRRAALGDALFARGILLDVRDTNKRRGSWVAEINFFRRDRFSATSTFFLRNGEVTVEGVTTTEQNLSRSGGEFAITGGTGAYEGGSGSLTVRDGVKVNGRRGSKFTLKIMVP